MHPFYIETDPILPGVTVALGQFAVSLKPGDVPLDTPLDTVEEELIPDAQPPADKAPSAEKKSAAAPGDKK